VNGLSDIDTALTARRVILANPDAVGSDKGYEIAIVTS